MPHSGGRGVCHMPCKAVGKAVVFSSQPMEATPGLRLRESRVYPQEQLARLASLSQEPEQIAFGLSSKRKMGASSAPTTVVIHGSDFVRSATCANVPGTISIFML